MMNRSSPIHETSLQQTISLHFSFPAQHLLIISTSHTLFGNTVEAGHLSLSEHPTIHLHLILQSDRYTLIIPLTSLRTSIQRNISMKMMLHTWTPLRRIRVNSNVQCVFLQQSPMPLALIPWDNHAQLSNRVSSLSINISILSQAKLALECRFIVAPEGIAVTEHCYPQPPHSSQLIRHSTTTISLCLIHPTNGMKTPSCFDRSSSLGTSYPPPCMSISASSTITMDR